MNREVSRSRALRWILLSALATILILASGLFWGWNNRIRPNSIVGDWVLDDLRTEDDDASSIAFHSTGVLDAGDPHFATHWRFADGQIHIRYWSTDSSTLIGNWFGDTTVYSWLTGSDEFPLIVEFNEDRSVMTLTALGEKPRLRLRRNRFEPGK